MAQWRLWGILFLSVIGVGVSSYLTYEKLSGGELVCLGGGQGCETVQNSPYSQIGPVPVAALGLLGYLLFGIVTILQMRERLWERRRLLAGLNFGLALGASLYSLYLTYLEVFVIYAICTWCVVSAVLVTLILMGALWELGVLSKETQKLSD